MLHTRLAVLAAAVVLVAACQDESPVRSGSAISPQLDSGVNATNGGGQRTLGDLPSVSVGGSQGAITTGVPSGKGAAY